MVNRRYYSFWIGCSLLGMVACNTPKPTSPNILFILVDDMGPAQLGCYGSDYYETPHIDQLAHTGLRFTQAYSAAAICSPTRSALMTAKSPAQLHLTDFIPGDRFPDKPLQTPAWQAFLPLTEKTLGERFQDLGYRTALFGKWHLSSHKRPPQSAPYNPDKQGFEETMITYKPEQGKTNPKHDPHNVDSITQRGIQFLQQADERPFFLLLSHNSIHDPLMESTEAIVKFRTKSAPQDSTAHPVWGAMVARLDRSVGRIIGVLDSLGLRDNTLVVLYSDNGAKHAYATQAPFRAGKGWLYEGGIRVPLMLNWPGKVPPGKTSQRLVTSMDMTPTLLQAAGVAVPDQIFEGSSFWSETKTKAGSNAPEVLYWHYPHYHRGSGMRPAGAVRLRNWKLIEWYEQSLSQAEGAYELYDLSQDPGEQYDLSVIEPDTLAMLLNELSVWRKQVGAQMPILNKR